MQWVERSSGDDKFDEWILTAALKFAEFIACVGGNASANCRLMINADIYILLRSLILWAPHRWRPDVGHRTRSIVVIE